MNETPERADNPDYWPRRCGQLEATLTVLLGILGERAATAPLDPGDQRLVDRARELLDRRWVMPTEDKRNERAKGVLAETLNNWDSLTDDQVVQHAQLAYDILAGRR